MNAKPDEVNRLLAAALASVAAPRVRLRFNLHRRDWSVKTGRAPVAHLPAACLVAVQFHVRESARQRVIARRCREVHAWAEGEWIDDRDAPSACAIEASYNPYRGPSFYRKDTGASIVG